MKIRLGYVAISKSLEGVTSSSTVTVSNFNKNNDYTKISNCIVSNLESLIKILEYNIKNNIHFYRLTSNLIPLATLKEISFDYLDNYKSYYKTISNLIHNNNIRIDMHPSQYCVLNSTRSEVVSASIEILKYHYNILKALNIKNKIIILHIGSSVLGKDNAIKRFINNYNKLPKYIQRCIVIENDDKVFNIDDCLKISGILNIPIVLDYHHFLCNNPNPNIEEYLPKIFSTWKNINPKIHFSSPKNSREFRSHHEYIDVDKFVELLTILKKYNQDIDIMLEAKAKDEAMFRLVRLIKYKTNYKFIDDTTFIV